MLLVEERAARRRRDPMGSCFWRRRRRRSVRGLDTLLGSSVRFAAGGGGGVALEVSVSTSALRGAEVVNVRIGRFDDV